MHMNKVLKNSLLVFLPGLLAFVVGWKIGTLQGAGVSTELHEAAKSIGLVSELNMLRSERIDDLIELKEIELDTALLIHSRYLDENHGWILFPFNNMYEPILESALIKSAEYRKLNPRTDENKELDEEMRVLNENVDLFLGSVE